MKIGYVWEAVVIFALLSFATPDTTWAQVSVINLTGDVIDGVAVSDSGVDTPFGEDVIGGFLEGTFFRRSLNSDDFGSGSGGFRDLYRVQDGSTATDPQDGYNRSVFDDVSIPGGFDPYLTVQELTPSVEGDSYVFAFDTHESTGGNNRYISLDEFRIYVGTDTDPATLPSTVADLGTLGTLVYDMNATSTSYVLIDSSLFAGSGQMDFFAFVPQAVFTGFSDTSYVYVYTSWGQYSFDASGRTSGFDTSATPEQVASGIQAYPSYAAVPEPSGAMLLTIAGIFWALRRPKRR